MSTITLPNIRVGSDLQIRVRLKDGGVAIDWSTLSNIKACIYSDAQRALAGRCAFSIDEEDNTLLVCTYAANKPQYLGVNRIVISAKYMGETKTYDKPAFSFVRWTADQEGEEITIDDPDVDVEITVEDISSSILQEAVDAAFTAADRANDAAAAAEHMVDIHTGPEGKSAYEVAVEEGYTGTEEEWLASLKGDTGETPDISIGTVTTVEPGTPAAASMTGTPEAPVLNLSIPQGVVGATPNFTVGTVTTGEPGSSVIVTITGTPEAPVLNLTIPQGMQGNTGSSVDYPYELVNNLTTNDATKGLSAAQGVVLAGQVSQLQQEVNGGAITKELTWTNGYIKKSDGSVNSSTASKFTQPFILKRGEKVTVGTSNSKICIIGTTAANSLSVGDTVTVLQSTGYPETFETHTLTATQDMKIVLCVKWADHTLSFEKVDPLNTRVAALEAADVVLDDKIDGVDADLQQTKEYIEHLVGVDVTVNENEGEIAYYTPGATGYMAYNAGQYTEPKDTAYKVTRIVAGPVRSVVDGTVFNYSVYISDQTLTGVPSQKTSVKTGTLKLTSNFAQYNIDLDSPLTVNPGFRIMVLFWTTGYNQVVILGTGSSGTPPARYNEKTHGVLFLAQNSDPMNASWSVGQPSGGKYVAVNPICKYYIESDIDTTIEEKIQEDAPAVVTEEVARQMSVGVHLPSKLYAVVGDTLQIFYRSIIGAIDPYAYDIVPNCSKGNHYPRFWQFTPEAGDVGTYPFSITVKDNKGNVLGTKETVIEVVASPSSPLSGKNVFCLGDSLTSGGVWCGEAKRRLVKTNAVDGITGKGLSNLAFCGSMHREYNDTPIDFFGVGGWTWYSYITAGTPGFRFQVSGVTSISVGATYTNNGHTYTVGEVNITEGVGNILCTTGSTSNTPTASGTLTKSSGNGDASVSFSSAEADRQNPLWDSVNDKMSFIPYVDEVGNGQIDALFVLLSWNGQSSWKEYSIDDVSGHIANAKVFLDTFHDEYPSAKCFVMGIQMPSVNGGLGANYGASGGYIDRYGLFETVFSYNEALESLCLSDDYKDFCEFVPVAPQFDSEYNMPYSSMKVNTRNTATLSVGTNGVHPATQGYYQIADAVYRSIVANFCQSE